MNELILLEDLGMMYPKENSKHKKRYGLYKCFCGNEFKSQTQDIKSGNTNSCGCYSNKIRTKHGYKKHILYSVWQQMIRRCTNPKYDKYKNYGGRGIKVCDRWLNVENFINDMYPSYKEGLSIDRIDVNGNYEPSNCRWANRNVQQRNTRRIMTTNTSGFRGETWHKQRQKWIAQIGVNKKKIHLGVFDTALEAAKAYDKYITDNNLEHTTNGLYTKA